MNGASHPFRRRAAAVPAEQQSRLVRRERPLALALRLYRQDPTFRGFAEFCVIGMIVLSFIQPGGISDLLKQKLTSVTSGLTSSEPFGTGKPVRSLADLLAMAHDRLYAKPPRRLYSAPFDRNLFRSSDPMDRERIEGAIAAYGRGDARSALSILRDASAGDRNVMLVRGVATLASPGAANAEAGIALLKAAATRGQRQAGMFLGLLYLNAPAGTITRDPEQGRHYLEQAADAGDRDAALTIAVAYHLGWGGLVDQARAAKYFRVAADLGDPDAALTLAYLTSQGIGVPRDDAEAERLMQKAAAGGNLIAQPLLGMYYLNQYVSGWIADPEPAVRWLTAASDQSGHPEASMLLGVFYTTPPVNPALRDLKKGAFYFQRCAERLFPPCLYAYGRALENGAGTPRDLVSAYAVYGLARDKGISKAREPLANLDQALSSDQKDAAKEIADNMVRKWPWSPFEVKGRVETMAELPGLKDTFRRRGTASFP